ncbi:MAG TPA: hypothetical protein VGL54_02070 [Solirubrobacteraceae bacterium]
MDIGSEESPDVGGTRLERAIVLQLLRDDRERMWPRAQLTSELQADVAEIDEAAVEQALRRLEQEGVVGCSEQEVWASSAARRLDELDLVGL